MKILDLFKKKHKIDEYDRYDEIMSPDLLPYCISFLKSKEVSVLANYYHLINCWYWVFPEHDPKTNKQGYKHFRVKMFQQELCRYIKSKVSEDALDCCEFKAIYYGMPEEPINKYIEDNY